MELELLLEKLKKVSQDKGLSKATIERVWNMPKNSLSGFMNGTKKIPPKWLRVLEVIAEGGEFPKPKETDTISKYCEENNCTIEDLIQAHKEMNNGKVYKEPIKPTFTATNEGIEDNKTEESEEIPPVASNKPQQVPEIDIAIPFEVDAFFVAEKYTKYPMKNRPNDHTRHIWRVKKQKEDALIRSAWDKFQKQHK